MTINTYVEKFDYLVDNCIATEDEITLVVKINGSTSEQLDNILFVRTGYTDFNKHNYYENCGWAEAEEEEEDCYICMKESLGYGWY